ncbi:hypothetical protein LCGC14_1373000 [marine sediment metagenome]|uniref:Uncharacterized protein n=1 Tax=marine sediment metagenome TaxID=412755 RepID=A0A0F9MK58_9ZZZZ
MQKINLLQPSEGNLKQRRGMSFWHLNNFHRKSEIIERARKLGKKFGGIRWKNYETSNRKNNVRSN